MAALPPAQVRALYPDKAAFVDRHGRGPRSPSALRGVLSETRQRGYATEDGEVTPGFASVAAAVLDHNGTPLGGIATTYETRENVDLTALVEAVSATARAVSRRLGGVSA
jgi:DNA-binding IclR family transcriptional regulator